MRYFNTGELYEVLSTRPLFAANNGYSASPYKLSCRGYPRVSS
ncbi:MAG: hypothetical protein ACJAYK_000857 [Crocinitomicaceae bacterium]|jgi:hypothetical protein